MVYFFESRHAKGARASSSSAPPPSSAGAEGGEDVFTLYMGRDKMENEELIAHGWPEDVWFHVDDLSSAHVYVRMRHGMTMEDIPEEVVADAAALTKANSIEGCKRTAVDVIYTPWSNLLKTADMQAGAVSFKDRKLVIKIRDVPKGKPRVNRLKKTRSADETPDFPALRAKRDRAVVRMEKKKAKAEAKARALAQAEADARAAEEAAEAAAREALYAAEYKSNKDLQDVGVEDFEDDFM